MTSASLANGCTPPPFPPFQPFLNSTPVQFVSNNLGEWNGMHTSNVSIAYINSTIPTPWPILIAGQFITLSTAAVTLARRKNSFLYSKPSHIEAIVLAVPVLYQIVRALASLVSLSKALSGIGGHFMPPSGCFALALSFMPASANQKLHVITRRLAEFGIVIGLVETSIASIVQLLHPKNINYYGKWFVTGGSCPRLIGDLDGWACLDQYYVGCGVATTVFGNQSSAHAYNSTLQSGQMATQDPNFFHNHNLIAVSEYGLSFVTFAVATFVLLVYFCILIGMPWDNFGKFFDFDLAPNEEGGVYKAYLAVFPVILIFTLVIFPLHYTSQTKPVSFVVQDSVGNISAAALKNYLSWQPMWQNWTGDGVDGKTWTDFFLVKTPVDRYGFLHYWWNIEDVSILRRLALM
jgi:hypothetical protein